MTDSTNTATPSPELIEAFVAACSELGPIAKSAKAHTWRYAPLDVVLDALQPAFAKHGLRITSDPESELDGDGLVVVVRTIVRHKGGGCLTSSPLRLRVRDSAQELGSALTYLRRYSVLSLVGVFPAGEDDDGAAASKPPPPAKKQQQAKQAPSRVRSVAEQRIRAALDDAHPAVARRVRDAFRDHFGTNLAGLETDRHEEAWNWTLNELDPDRIENRDAIAKHEADEAHADAEAPQANPDAEQ